MINKFERRQIVDLRSELDETFNEQTVLWLPVKNNLGPDPRLRIGLCRELLSIGPVPAREVQAEAKSARWSANPDRM